MADKALTRVLAAAIVVVAAGALRADSLREAARRESINALIAAEEGNAGIVFGYGEDSRAGEQIVALFRREADGTWSMQRGLLICDERAPSARKEKSPAPAAPAPTPAAGLPPATSTAAPSSGPVAMPPPRDLSDGFVRSIQDDLRRRARQSVAGDVEKSRRNAAYLKDLVQDIGWINLKRFGVAASCDAAKIVEKGGDRELLAAAVAQMEKDLKNSDEGRECYEAAEKAYRETSEK